MNTAIASACSRLAGADQVGGLYGVMESVENLAGLVGPALGGLLFKVHKTLPIVTVVVIYFCVFVAVWMFYRSTIIDYTKKRTSTTKSEEAVDTSIGMSKSQYSESMMTVPPAVEEASAKKDDGNCCEDVLVVDDVTDVEVDLSEHEKEGNSFGSAALSDEESVKMEERESSKLHLRGVALMKTKSPVSVTMLMDEGGVEGGVGGKDKVFLKDKKDL